MYTWPFHFKDYLCVLPVEDLRVWHPFSMVESMLGTSKPRARALITLSICCEAYIVQTSVCIQNHHAVCSCHSFVLSLESVGAWREGERERGDGKRGGIWAE